MPKPATIAARRRVEPRSSEGEQQGIAGRTCVASGSEWLLPALQCHGGNGSEAPGDRQFGCSVIAPPVAAPGAVTWALALIE
jgi:hypothetical protein